MNSLRDLVEAYPSTFEGCLLSEDSGLYLKSMPDSFQKNLLLHLFQPLNKSYEEILKTKFKLSSSLVRQIMEWKNSDKIQKASNAPEIKELIEGFKNKSKRMFDYPKPADFHQKQEKEEKGASDTVPSDLVPILPLEQWAKKQLESNPNSFSSFSDLAIKAIPEKQLLQLKLQNKSVLFNRLHLLNYFSDKFCIQFLADYYKQIRSMNKSFEFPDSSLRSLTNVRLQKLKKAIPELSSNNVYLSQWFKRRYQERLSRFQKQELTISEKDEKRQLLLSILDDLHSEKNPKLKNLIKTVSLQVLQLDIEREDPDKKFLLKFLADFPLQTSLMKPSVREAYAKDTNPRINIHLFNSINEQRVSEQYAKKLFALPKGEETLKELLKYFEEKPLRRLYATVKLLNGGSPTQAEQYLTLDEIKQIKDRKALTILSKTKRKIKVDDDVELKLRVKNVSNVRVKIYKVDLEKRHLENLQWDPHQDLSYLCPTDSFTYEVDNSNPYKEACYDIIVSQIEKKRGMWVVELEGEQITSRAVIYKGAITAVQNPTSAGVELTFYNQSGEQIKQIQIWFENKKFKINNSYTIPYGQSSKNLNILAVKDGLAENISVWVQNQSYKFEVAYIYDSENFIVGNKAKVILHPRLRVDSQTIPVNLKLIKKAAVTVELQNSVGIKNTLDFDNVVFKNDEDYVLEFPIQSYTKQIKIAVEGKIELYSGKEQKVSSQKVITIDLNENSKNFLDLYLKKTSHRGYCVYLLGQNGEPIPKSEINISFTPNGRHIEQSKTLITDKDGVVGLGNIGQHADSVTARARGKDGTVQRNWSFRRSDTQIIYPYSQIYKVGETIDLPILHGTAYSLLKKNTSDFTLGCYNDHSTVKNGRLLIKDLPEGKYEFTTLQNSRMIEITVMKAVSWNHSQLYSEEQGLLVSHKNSKEKAVALADPKITKQQGRLEIRIPVSVAEGESLNKNFRGHLIASNFVTPQLLEMFQSKNYNIEDNLQIHSFEQKRCEFYNDKTLSEESSYVMHRMNQKKYIGNNLEKPRIFLKRIEVKETNEVDQVLGEAGMYQRCMPQACMMKMANKRAAGYADMESNAMMRKAYHEIEALIPNRLNAHNNFLFSNGSLISNLKGNEMVFQVPNCYSHFHVVLLSSSNAIEKTFDYAADQTETKSLTHFGIEATDSSKAWTMSRQVYPIRKGQNIKVSRDSTWCAVGLQNILGFAKIKGARLEEWVGSWNSYSEAEKLKVYDEKVCHELNTYIKSNDAAFFIKVVKPFIENKVTKTFVDLCLLQSEDCLAWTKIEKFNKLNEFEKVLLVQQLVRSGNNAEAENIANAMNDMSRAKRIAFNTFKNHFDTIITAKLIQQFKEQKKMSKFVSRQDQNQVRKKCKKRKMLQKRQEKEQEQFDEEEDVMMLQQSLMSQRRRENYRKPFTQMQKTKQYTETTYSGIKNPQLSTSLVADSPFWAAAAKSAVSGASQLLTENFMYLSSTLDFTLASCFVPNSKVLQYNLKTEGEHIVIEAEEPFLVFVKEVKQLDFEKKFGVLINQRFFNPDDMYYYEEDGTRIEKEVKEFVVRKSYMVQTLVTNTSGTELELQLLIDIPKGSLPLMSHEYTLIQSVIISPYSTQEFQRLFYFPAQGSYALYPANASRGNTVIARAEKCENLNVLSFETANAMDSFQDILKSGNKAEILKFLASKNIYDDKVLDLSSILWMLRDKDFFKSVIKIFRSRKLYEDLVWVFGYFHEDIETIKEYHRQHSRARFPTDLPIFEFFPYYSSRTHKFQNQNKSTIRNTDFKNVYYEFLFGSLLAGSSDDRNTIVFIYYLLLQDRIDDASAMLSRVSDKTRKECQLQFDYIECFIDMYNGYPSFTKARRISNEYSTYPVKSWQKMFQEIADTLKEYDSEEVPQQEKAKVNFQTNVINEGHQLRISVPPNTEVEVLIFEINLELYFSAYPFATAKNTCSLIQPNTIKKLKGTDSVHEEVIARPEGLKDCIVEVFASVSQMKKKKVSEFQWKNPKVQVNIKEQLGVAQIFYDGKRCPGCYCKVYQNKNGSHKFYRDGYSDITGTFKYALADLEGISEFSILFITENGGTVEQVKPPSQIGYIQ